MTELDHGSLASIKTLLWTHQSPGAVLTHSCTAVLWHEDVVHGSHVDVIGRRFLLGQSPTSNRLLYVSMGGLP